MKHMIELEWIGAEQDRQMASWYKFEKQLGYGYRSEYKSNRPWVAKIIGFHEHYGFDREFLDGDLDYSEANSVGSRGVKLRFIVRTNWPYEIKSNVSWSKDGRYFAIFDDEGTEQEMEKEEVEKWLENYFSIAPY